MRKNNNIIEINGQRYDAITGAVLSHAGPSQSTTKPLPSAAHSPRPAKPKPTMHDVVRRSAKQHASHPPATAHTLMRQAVKKPRPSLKRQSRAQGHVDTPDKQPLSRLSVGQLDAERLRHAKQIPKSRLISHFPAFTAGDTDRPAWPTKPVSQTPQLAPPKPPRHQAKRHPKTTSELLEQAVQQATSHLELPPKPAPHSHGRAKRNAGIGAAMALMVLILGVIVTQNLSSVRLQMASAKAGFSVSLPSYQPAGYSLGQLNYSDGVAAVQFHSNSDQRHYSITQKRSSWDSATLRDTFVAPIDDHYQTIQAGGRTIYLYGNHNATWIDSGIWFVVQTDGSLSDRQLTDLATSL
jgi:hypothetical protein